MPAPDVVVIGGSAGGLQAISEIVKRLPASLPASVLLVLHSSSNGQGILAEILSRISALPVALARDGEALAPGRIYVAPPDFHLLVEGTSLSVVHGPRENRFRPAVDPLFRTAARALGPRVTGVVLSGALSDGTYGLSVIKHHGGVAIVQDPEDAAIPDMPLSALRHLDVDYVLPATRIASVLERLTRRAADEGESDMSDLPRSEDLEPQRPDVETNVNGMQQRFGAPSALTCPDCGGALWEVQDDRVVRYQCHVGHQYAPEDLEAGQRDAIDGALWSAVRVLEEHAELKMRMAKRAAEGGLPMVSAGFEEGARDAHTQAQQIRSVLFALGAEAAGPATEASAQRRPARARATRSSSSPRKPRRPPAGRSRKRS